MSFKRSVVTGMGCILPFGKNLDKSINSIKANGKRDIYDFTSKKYGNSPVGLVPDEYFDVNFEEREKARYDRISMLVASVVGQCIESAVIKDQVVELENTGIICGSLLGCIHSDDLFRRTFYEDGPSMLDPMKFPFMSHNYPVSISAIKYGLKGPITSVVSSISSSLNALGFAHYLITKGQAKRIIVIGFDEITDLGYSLLKELGYINNEKNTTAPATQSEDIIPFEGCTGIVIEDKEVALQRRTKIFGEILSWDASYGSYQNVHYSRIKKNIIKTIDKSSIDKNSIDLLLLNKSGFPYDDDAEALAIQKLENEGYSFATTIGLKSIIGNYMGASGLTEIALTLKMMNDNINLRNFVVSKTSEKDENVIDNKAIDSVLINNFGLGGNIVSFLLKKYFHDNINHAHL